MWPEDSCDTMCSRLTCYDALPLQLQAIDKLNIANPLYTKDMLWISNRPVLRQPGTCAIREFQPRLADTWSDEVVRGHRGACATCSCNGQHVQCRTQILALWVLMFVISGTGHAALMGRCALHGALLSLECALPAQAQALHAGMPYMHRAKSAGRACENGKLRCVQVSWKSLSCAPEPHWCPHTNGSWSRCLVGEGFRTSYGRSWI